MTPSKVSKEIMEKLALKLVKREKDGLEGQIFQFCQNANQQLAQFKQMLMVYDEEASMYITIGETKPGHPGFPAILKNTRAVCQDIVELVDKLERDMFPPQDPLKEGDDGKDPLDTPGIDEVDA